MTTKTNEIRDQVLEYLHKRFGRRDAIPGMIEPGPVDTRFMNDEDSGEDVFVAVVLSRLNGQDAYFVAGALTVVEHENAAILRAPRVVAEWLRDEGTYVVIGGDPSPDPVQIVDRDIDHKSLETAVVLWEPYDNDSVFANFQAALEAACRLERDRLWR